MRNQPQLSIDEQAARMAEQMLSKGGAAGDLPESRKEAEGGFTEDAGGMLIDAGQKGSEAMKSQKATSHQTSEPGRQGGEPKTTSAITDEPGHQEAGAKPGEGGNLGTDEDEKIRARKPGQIGVSGGSAGKGMSEDEDDKIRARKPGRVGIQGQASESFGKSDDKDEDDKDGDKDKFGGKKAPPFGKACGMKKAKDEEDEDEKDDEDEDETEKGMVDVDSLMKSLDTLEAIAEGASIPAERDRRAELAEKLALGTLNKSEMSELHDLTKSEPEVEAVEEELIEKSHQDQFAADPTMSEGYDVSPFLERQSQLLAASLDQIQDRLGKSLSGQHENTRAFNTVLAKSLRGMAQLSRDQSEMIKSLTARLEQVENTPLPRKGHSSIRTLSKSMVGEVGGGESELSKSQIFDALESMAMKQDYAPCGIKLTDAVAQFESTGQITKSLMGDVMKQISKGNGVR